MLVAPQYEAFSYQRRIPEQELLHQILLEHLETFLDRARTLKDEDVKQIVETTAHSTLQIGANCLTVGLKRPFISPMSEYFML